MNPLNIAAIVGVVLVLAFAVVLIQPENSAISQNDDTQINTSEISDSTSPGINHDTMMIKHHSMMGSFSQTEHTISVTGTAQTNVQSNLLVIEFGVETNGDTAKSALDSNSVLLSNSVNALKSMGISDDDLNTLQFSITPLYDYYQDKDTGRHTSELIGYQVTNILQVKTDKLDSADIVIAHNANKFDLPTINARAVEHGIKPPSPYKVVDTLSVAKKHFRFTSNKLEFIADALGCAPKLKHQHFPGFELWLQCLKQNDKAWKEMKEYNDTVNYQPLKELAIFASCRCF